MRKKQPYYKYQSLGNEFILLDWLNEEQTQIQNALRHSDWPEKVKRWCDRKQGIGADGVLIVKSAALGDVEGLIFNADGSQAEICLNGLRCIAHFLFHQHAYAKQFSVLMSNKLMRCEIEDSGVRINIQAASDISPLTLMGNQQEINGYRVDMGNPHFVVLQKVTLKWLQEHGPFIESHAAFPHRTNVEFVWQTEESTYQMLVYERGCGITAACGSGAAAVMLTLYQLGKIKTNQNVILLMNGGSLVSSLSDDLVIYQQGEARLEWQGVLI